MNIDKLILKFIWRGRRHIVDNNTIEGEEQFEELILPKFRTHCKSTTTKNTVVLAKKK